MPTTNLIDIKITDEKYQRLDELLTEMEEILLEFTINLTPKERIQHSRMSNHSENWVEKIQSYISNWPDLVPFYLKRENFERDLHHREQMKPLMNRMASLHECLDDTTMLLGSDIYTFALSFYRHIKTISVEDVQGITSIYEDLKSQFPGRPSKMVSGGSNEDGDEGELMDEEEQAVDQ